MNLSQSTGEDWNDAKLILSTSETDVLNAGIPTSDGLVIEQKFKPPPPPMPPAIMPAGSAKAKRKKATVGSALPAPDDVDSSIGGANFFRGIRAAVLPEMSEGGAVISKSPMAVNYTVDELTTIPSNGESHKVLVALIPLEAVISHITTPRKSPLAYLQVRPSPVLTHRITHRVVSCSAQ